MKDMEVFIRKEESAPEGAEHAKKGEVFQKAIGWAEPGWRLRKSLQAIPTTFMLDAASIKGWSTVPAFRSS